MELCAKPVREESQSNAQKSANIESTEKERGKSGGRAWPCVHAQAERSSTPMPIDHVSAV